MNTTTYAILALAACACWPSGGGDRPAIYEAGANPLQADDEAQIPCAPRAVLQQVCQRCHARPTLNGAPFPLVRRSDVLAAYRGATVRDLMADDLDAGRMPLSPVTIAGDQRDVLLGWLLAGAPPVEPTSCADDAGADDAGADDADVDAADAATSDDASSE